MKDEIPFPIQNQIIDLRAPRSKYVPNHHHSCLPSNLITCYGVLAKAAECKYWGDTQASQYYALGLSCTRYLYLPRAKTPWQDCISLGFRWVAPWSYSAGGGYGCEVVRSKNSCCFCICSWTRFADVLGPFSCSVPKFPACVSSTVGFGRSNPWPEIPLWQELVLCAVRCLI